MTRHLIITADDYGPHWYINAGILEAINDNLVTSVSVLTNNYAGYAFEQVMNQLVSAIGTKPIGIGCHLSLTSGKPLTKASTLVNGKGEFRDIRDFLFHTDRAHLAEVKQEVQAQISRLAIFLAAKNIPLDHVSFHHGVVGIFTPYNTALLEVMIDNNWHSTVRNPLIITKDPRFKEFIPSMMKWLGIRNSINIFLNQTDEVKEVLKGIMNPVAMKRKGEAFRESHIPVPTYLIDIFYRQPGSQILKKIIKYLPYNGNYSYGELMVHLGSGDLNAAKKLDFNGIDGGYFIFRRNELRVLKTFFEDEGWRQTDIVFVPMGAVPLFQTLNPKGEDVVYG